MVRAVNGANFLLPAGDIKAGRLDYNIYTNNQFTLVRPMEDIVVRKVGVNETPIHVKDVGTVVVALLMVSTFRYYSFKEVDFARRRPAQVLVLVVLGVLIVATHPQWFLFILFSLYLLSGPTRPVWVCRRLDQPMVNEKGTRDAH